MTSWIDGSFIYSSSEAWTNTMRSFKNGSLLMEPTRNFPVRNTMRAPLFNHAVPHVMRMLSPERLYREFDMFLIIRAWFSLWKIVFSPWRSTNESASSLIGSWNIVLSVAQCGCRANTTGESKYVWRRYLSESKTYCYSNASGSFIPMQSNKVIK